MSYDTSKHRKHKSENMTNDEKIKIRIKTKTGENVREDTGKP